MTAGTRKMVIIGAGIAGLCAAVHARRCGYEVEVVEQHDAAGGLATSWHRGGYTFETCLHWLVGCDPHGALHAQWREVLDIDRLRYVFPDEFARIVDARGNTLPVYTDVDRMEAELLRQAPQDAAEIRRFADAVRSFARFPVPDVTLPWPRRLLALLRVVPYLPLLRRWSRLSLQAYGSRFSHPLLRGFFGDGEMAQLSMVALLFSLAWMSQGNAAYVVGGSQAIIRPIRERLEQLGGRLRLAAKVEEILVENDAAVGVRLADGATLPADWVISAADAHATIYDLLDGRYVDAALARRLAALTTFPSYLQVSFGVAADLSRHGGSETYLLDTPLELDPTTRLSQVMFRYFHFDPTFAAPGKTAVTCFLPTRNFAYWTGLQHQDPARYQAEKARVAAAVTAILARAAPDIGALIEVVDVATPATVIRYTGNWQGSMEGWLLTPGTGVRPLPNRLPGLRRLLLAGHWVQPGGGLPSGLMTARTAVRAICRADGVPFVAG